MMHKVHVAFSSPWLFCDDCTALDLTSSFRLVLRWTDLIQLIQVAFQVVVWDIDSSCRLRARN